MFSAHKLKPAVQLRMETSLSTVPQGTNATSSTQETPPLASLTGDSALSNVETLVFVITQIAFEFKC